jgi:hypothetical protein
LAAREGIPGASRPVFVKEVQIMTIDSTTARRTLAALLVVAALAVAGCGGGSSSSKSTSSSSAPAATSTSSGSSAGTKNGIPQGPNAGDADSDNQGAPSDGDGNL